MDYTDYTIDTKDSIDNYITVEIGGVLHDRNHNNVNKIYNGLMNSEVLHIIPRPISFKPLAQFEQYAITKVIFNDPATIVFWEDGTKTVVKCGEDDIWDPEKGLTMAIVKKLLGNKGNYYNIIRSLLNNAAYYEDYEYKNTDNKFSNVFSNWCNFSSVLSKNVPKTVVKKMRIRYGNEEESYFTCPVCDDEILKSGARYCANCGQRLIWEEK